MSRIKLTRTLVVAALFAAFVSCGQSFDPYNLLTEMRLLAVRADQPIVPVGGATTLDALVYHPDEAAPEYEWSWCPLRGGSAQGYACFVSEEDMQALAPSPSPISFELGTAETAAFTHLGSPEQLIEICAQALGPFDLETGGSIDCTSGFPISIGLTIRHGEAEIRSFKTVYLALDPDAALNANPTIEGVRIGDAKAKRDTSVALEPGDASFVARMGEEYMLYADVPEEASELFVPPKSEGESAESTREYLAMTWFVEAGDTRSQRTTFIDGQVGFDVLEKNTWEMPQPEEFDGDEVRLLMVVRDDRGGIGWTERSVKLERP